MNALQGNNLLGGMGRPLVPTASGSATEQTARDRLPAIRDLEQTTRYGDRQGAGIGGSSGAASGGGTGPGTGAGGGGGTGRSGGGGGTRRSGFAASGATGSAGHGATRRSSFGHGGVASGQAGDGSTGGGGSPSESGAQQTGEPGQYRPVYNLGSADLSDAVVNTVAGEAQLGDPKSVDAVINDLLNRVGRKDMGRLAI